MLPLLRWFRHLRLRYFSQPVHDRTLYQAVWKKPVHKLVLLGIGDGRRSLHLLELIQQRAPGRIELTGLDLFEMRGAQGSGLTLKEAHRRLSATGAKVRLLPGDPFSGLSAAANGLAGTQLLIISADQDPESLARAWFYVPRMLSAEATVFLEQPGNEPDTSVWRVVGRDELERLASRPRPRRAA